MLGLLLRAQIEFVQHEAHLAQGAAGMSVAPVMRTAGIACRRRLHGRIRSGARRVDGRIPQSAVARHSAGTICRSVIMKTTPWYGIAVKIVYVETAYGRCGVDAIFREQSCKELSIRCAREARETRKRKHEPNTLNQPPAETAKPREARVLLVDDDRELCQMLTEYLEAEHFDVKSVHDGGEALANCSANDFEILILDVMLPSVGGFDVLRKLGASARHAHSHADRARRRRRPHRRVSSSAPTIISASRSTRANWSRASGPSCAGPAAARRAGGAG